MIALWVVLATATEPAPAPSDATAVTGDGFAQVQAFITGTALPALLGLAVVSVVGYMAYRYMFWLGYRDGMR